jgi:hypothetical protein
MLLLECGDLVALSTPTNRRRLQLLTLFPVVDHILFTALIFLLILFVYYLLGCCCLSEIILVLVLIFSKMLGRLVGELSVLVWGAALSAHRWNHLLIILVLGSAQIVVVSVEDVSKWVYLGLLLLRWLLILLWITALYILFPLGFRVSRRRWIV